MVPCFFLNPNWWLGIKFAESICGDSDFNISLSNIFERTGDKLIGRYDVTCVTSLPDLGIITISDCFQDNGKYPVLNIELKINITTLKAEFGRLMTIVLVILSPPGDFFGFRPHITAFGAGRRIFNGSKTRSGTTVGDKQESVSFGAKTASR